MNREVFSMKKRTQIVLLCLVIAFTLTVQVPASGSDSRDNAAGFSLDMMVRLGIFDTEQADLSYDSAVTREEYVRIIAKISGQEKKTVLYENNSLFPDIPASHRSNGVIGMAAEQGYITAMPDGLFHPDAPITYSQLAPGIVKLLGYIESDLSGNWPYNYLNLMASLNILDGIRYSPQAEVLRKDFAVIINRLFQTEIKGGQQLFIDTTGIYKNIIVFENGNIRNDLDPLRILTDCGEFYLQEGMPQLEPGHAYIVKTENNIIQAFAGRDYEYENYSVKGVSGQYILLNNGKSMQLPKNIKYYYGGIETDSGSITDCLQANSSVIIAFENGEPKYGVVYDPVYSSPKIITQAMTSDMLESMYSGRLIDRQGKSIRPSQLEVNDVVYEITDIWKNNGFILVYAQKAEGDVTAILPNLISPTSIEIDGVAYQLDSSFPKRKISGTGAIETGQTVTVLLGKDGKAVDIILSGTGENDHFVLVVDSYSETSRRAEDFGKTLYFVNLLHTDGSIKTYLTKRDMSALKGDLATYSILETGEDYDTVTLTQVKYLEKKTHEVFKDERRLDDSYVTDNVIIFNLIHNIYGRNSEASILKWSDLPSGKLEASKVKYIHTTGDFKDIDVIFLDNVLDEGISYGLVTGYKTNYTPMGTEQVITMLIQGEEYVYSTDPIPGLSTGAVLKLRMSGSSILSVSGIVYPYASSDSIQAADTSRIRINDTTYRYHRDFTVYKLKTGNVWKRVGTNEISKETEVTVTLYLDKPLSYGGKVVMALIR